MGASSHTMRLVLRSKTANASFRFAMAHDEASVHVIGMRNLECAVRPPCTSKAAIPLEATGIATWPFVLTLPSNALSTVVFPVPAGASKKNARLSDGRASRDWCAAYDDTIGLTVSNTVFCSLFNVS